MKVKVSLCAIVAFSFLPLVIYAQNDAAKISEAKYALEQHNDCKSAKLALSEVSGEGRNSPLFIYYFAKTYDCMQEFDSAIIYYNKYLEYVPNEPAIIKRVAELNYWRRASDLSGEWFRETGNRRITYTITSVSDNIKIQCSEKPADTFFSLKKVSSNRYEGQYKTAFGEGEKDEMMECTYEEDNQTKDFYCQVCCNNRHYEKAYAIVSSDKKTLNIYIRKKFVYTTAKHVNAAVEYFQNTGNKTPPICLIGEENDYSFAYSISK